MPDTVHLDGPCPLLFCLETGPHDHPICPKCRAVNYGNLFCVTCRELRPQVDAQIAEALLDGD